MISQDLVVKHDAVFVFVNALQRVFRIHPRGLLVTSFGADLAQIHTLYALQNLFLTLIR